MNKPTIAELEAIMSEKGVEIDIRPNGEVYVKSELQDAIQRAEKAEARIAELEAARKVADAAVAVEITGDARIHVGAVVENLDWEPANHEALAILYDAQLQAMCTLNNLVTEYRKLTEEPQ